MQDEKKWEDVTRTKKMGRQDARQKTNWETRCEMKKKWGDETRDRKTSSIRTTTRPINC